MDHAVSSGSHLRGTAPVVVPTVTYYNPITTYRMPTPPDMSFTSVPVWRPNDHVLRADPGESGRNGPSHRAGAGSGQQRMRLFGR